MCTRTASLYADRTKCGPLTSDVISKSVHCVTDDEAYQSLRGWCPQDCQRGSERTEVGRRGNVKHSSDAPHRRPVTIRDREYTLIQLQFQQYTIIQHDINQRHRVFRWFKQLAYQNINHHTELQAIPRKALQVGNVIKLSSQQ
eukprot:scaffold4321_cov107-Alexandrium_tamarense.AAC.1